MTIRTGVRPDLRIRSESESESDVHPDLPKRTPTDGRTDGLTEKYSPQNQAFNFRNARTHVSGSIRYPASGGVRMTDASDDG